MKKFENGKMSDMELENVAGGQTFWYMQITGTWEDPATGREYKDGFLVRLSNIATGEKASSKWMTAKEFDIFREKMEHRGHEFIEGDSNPGGVDGLVKS